MQEKILGSVWYTAQQFGGSIGFVAIKSGPDLDKWKVYVGIGFGGLESVDEQMIAGSGAKVTKAVALAHFPDLDPEKFVY